MLVTTLFTVALAATSTLALPRGIRVPRGQDSCQTTIGTNAFGTLGPFTIAAINQTDDVATSTGVPLHLSPSVSSAGNDSRSLATDETYPRVEFPEFRLVNGGIVAAQNASTGLGAAATDVGAGDALSFEVSRDPLPPASVFCAVVGTSPAGGNPKYPLLALHGDTHRFALCKGHSRENNIPFDVIVYQPSANRSDEYAYESCYPVFVQLVPTEPY
ncbi:uncharacterized protein TRAVEDRAFT_21802 [Trametes versicolor FP-101664 SS1]|uniref:uncharacterized protein n=1 Tax=Trametes versicolor (strain FP-101664) TaxID=717944 RepID=UPI0004621744|nr:uncharacterized protein TRAVEDRAFT_21802 [Trametes versicolor FP-101664 SS1]EIW56746.1 hypothetical protein TRAVEDRAFT_21802 [Trametes versicolor FP-101664 SS1]